MRVKDAFLHVPLFPILTGSPVFTLKMKEPLIHAIQFRSGQLNLMTLWKAPSKEISHGTHPSHTKQPTEAEKGVPGIVARARLGVELRNAILSYKDLMTGLDTEVKDLNLNLHNMSLTHPTELEALGLI